MAWLPKNKGPWTPNDLSDNGVRISDGYLGKV